MKKLLLLIIVAATNVFGAESYTDLIKGVDFTGRSALSPTALNQLVDNARLNTNRGLIFRSSATPDVTASPRFTNFIWLDTTLSGLVQLKVWNDTVWTNVYLGNILTETNIADGAITTPKLASGAVSADKILNGAVGSLQLAGSGVTADKIAVGVINRSHLSDNLIGTAQITNSAVTGVKIADGTITSEKIASVNAYVITNLSTYALPQTNLDIGKLPQPSYNNSNYTLITGPNSLTWTTAPIAEVVYHYPWAGTFRHQLGYYGSESHFLGRKPFIHSVVFEFTNSYYGNEIGDEVSLSSLVISNASVTTRVYPINYSLTATSVMIRCDTQFWTNGTANRWFCHNGTNGSETVMGGIFFPTNLGRFKFYLR